jgi:hypothetical protein
MWNHLYCSWARRVGWQKEHVQIPGRPKPLEPCTLDRPWHLPPLGKRLRLINERTQTTPAATGQRAVKDPPDRSATVRGRSIGLTLLQALGMQLVRGSMGMRRARGPLCCQKFLSHHMRASETHSRTGGTAAMIESLAWSGFPCQPTNGHCPVGEQQDLSTTRSLSGGRQQTSERPPYEDESSSIGWTLCLSSSPAYRADVMPAQAPAFEKSADGFKTGLEEKKTACRV